MTTTGSARRPTPRIDAALARGALSLLTLGALAGPCLSASPAPAAPPASASAAASAVPGPGAQRPPRPQTAREKVETSTAPGALRPERPVVPQIGIPLGQRAAGDGERTPVLRTARPNRAAQAASGGVDDAAARCEAQARESDRTACLARLAREDREGPPVRRP
jgi:hypothetical protein